MNPDQENFEALRKLLALKKYEQPPPRYFSELPSKIWIRIEREPETFWERFLPDLRINPGLAYSFGLLACATLVFGLTQALNTENSHTAIRPITGQELAAPQMATTDGISPLGLSNFDSKSASTNPVINPEPLPSLFGTPRLQVAPASFSPGQ